MANALDLTADLLYARWKRAVDLLWRETVRRRREDIAERERARSARRMRNLQRIVRRALADYHRIELERQDCLERKSRAEIGDRKSRRDHARALLSAITPESEGA